MKPRRVDLEVDPHVAPITEVELRLLTADDRTEGNVHERLAVVDGARVRVLAHLELEHDAANTHLASAEIFGAGEDHEAGRLVLTTLLDIAEADGRTLFLGWGRQTEAEAGFWSDVGAERKYIERVSSLDVSRVDRALMDEWIDQHLDRAADVKLTRWVGACPEEHLDAWALSRSAMSDAPKDDLDVNDSTLDAADIREDEDARRVLGTRLMNLFAIDPNGDPVGHTTIAVNTHRPAASWQWDTVVLKPHRRRGIGRWLKAEMWLWLREAEPDVSRLLTGNAESNDAMLAINVAMGFQPAATFGVWQAPIADIRAKLS